jgi:RNA polymerase sigma-70 factor (ECF subfamily)
MTTEKDETLLVILAQRGDIAAFEQLLRRTYKPLLKYVTTMVGESTADDVLQEVSFRTFRQIGRLREPSVYRPWVFRIATRISYAYLKSQKRWRELENNPDLIRSTPTVTLPEQAEFDHDFLALLDWVSPASRAVLLLHYQQQLSLEETAAILDIPLGTAKSRLSYGISTIRNFLKEGQQIEHR